MDFHTKLALLRAASVANIESLRQLLEGEEDTLSLLASFGTRDELLHECLVPAGGSPTPETHCLNLLNYPTSICASKFGWTLFVILSLASVMVMASIIRHFRVQLEEMGDEHQAELQRLRDVNSEQKTKLEDVTALAVEIVSSRDPM
jgi:hypothetical protein